MKTEHPVPTSAAVSRALVAAGFTRATKSQKRNRDSYTHGFVCTQVFSLVLVTHENGQVLADSDETMHTVLNGYAAALSKFRTLVITSRKDGDYRPRVVVEKIGS